jgi:hypothetical protein
MAINLNSQPRIPTDTYRIQTSKIQCWTSFVMSSVHIVDCPFLSSLRCEHASDASLSNQCACLRATHDQNRKLASITITLSMFFKHCLSPASCKTNKTKFSYKYLRCINALKRDAGILKAFTR